MDKTQVIDKRKTTSNLLLAIHGLNLFLLAFNFTLNFLGSPELKLVYLAQVILILITVLAFSFENVLFEILILFFIEGQGRIIWEYQSWARIIFDLVTFVAIAKIFISRKKLFDRQSIPFPIIIFISLHFLWYLIQLFNVYALSVFGSLAASKIYIFPILLFLAIIMSDMDERSKEFNRVLNIFITLLILEMALNYYQVTVKQSHLLSISGYYFRAMRNGVFTGRLFRPFATTQLPGALAAFLFLTVGFLYLKKTGVKGTFLKILIMLASAFSILTCQVRSALVKYLLIVGLIQFGKMFYDRFRPRSVLPVFIIGLTLMIGAKTFLLETDSTGDENLDYAKSRISTLTQVDKLKGERLNLNDFGKIITQKISDYPLGLGPGMTGPAASLNKDEMVANPFVNEDLLWTSDNLYISLVMDLGIGALFYMLLIFAIPIFFIRNLITLYSKKIEHQYNVLLVCTSTLLVILIGNWGALGLTYNPESFVFWFFAALGFKAIHASKEGTSPINSASEKYNLRSSLE